MLGFDKSKITDVNAFVGEGYLHRDGKDIERIKVSKIDDLNKVIEKIKVAMEK